VLILVDEPHLGRDALQQASVRRGVGLVGHPLAEQQHADEAFSRSRDRDDQADAEALEPAALAVRQRAVEVRREVLDRRRAVNDPEQRLLL